MKRTASAQWKGSLKDGKGTLAAPGGVLKATPYSFATRFGDTPGTNPEELIAAAHAGCFSMAFSAALGKEGFTPTAIDTTANLSLDQVGAGFEITTIELTMTAAVPEIDQAKFQAIAEDAKANCPVSKVLKGAKISLKATLKS
jgi:osmotically inducible protein OsmC